MVLAIAATHTCPLFLAGLLPAGGIDTALVRGALALGLYGAGQRAKTGEVTVIIYIF